MQYSHSGFAAGGFSKSKVFRAFLIAPSTHELSPTRGSMIRSNDNAAVPKPRPSPKAPSVATALEGTSEGKPKPPALFTFAKTKYPVGETVSPFCARSHW